MIGSVLVNLAVSAGVVAALLIAVFVVSVRRDRHDTIDTAWGLGFALVAVTSYLVAAPGQPVITALTALWGLRLSIHIGLRSRGTQEDRRYVDIRRRANGNLGLVRAVYLPQAVVLLIVSLPVQTAQYAPTPPPALLAAGIAVWLIGFAFETIGDLQLTRFKANPANHGQVLDHGLWRYSRHPNYFGDACVWAGLYLLACTNWLGVATVLSPVLMTYLLVRGTGKPLLEANLRQSRPDYVAYVQRTSGFFPLPPKHGR